MSRRSTEILPHIAAPSRAADDKKYRTLAGAYLDFQPTRRTAIFKTQELSDGIKTPKHKHVHPLHLHSSPQSGRKGESFELYSPQLSFRSVENNLDSPRLRQVPDPSQLSQASSWQAPPSEIPDSHPESNRPLENFCSPTRLLEHFLSGLDSSQSDHSPLAYRNVDRQAPAFYSSQETNALSDPASAQVEEPQDGTDREHGSSSQLPPVSTSPLSDREVDYFPADSQDGHIQPPPARNLVQSVQIPSSLPVQAPNINDDQRGNIVIPQSPIMNNKRARLIPPTPAGGDISHITSSYPSQTDRYRQPNSMTSSPRADSEPPPPKRLRVSRHDPDPGRLLPRSSSDIGPRQAWAKGKFYQKAVGPKRPTGNLNMLEISSPLPPVGEADLDPAGMVTEALAKLAKDLDLGKRFNPELQSREIRPFERGYWLVDCRRWEDDLKRTCWGFLADYLTKGLAGWGTRCDRDPEFLEMRLWCFGHMVGHIYLLLYLASRREVRHTGLSWIGGDGKAVIKIGTKPAPAW